MPTTLEHLSRLHAISLEGSDRATPRDTDLQLLAEFLPFVAEELQFLRDSYAELIEQQMHCSCFD